MNLGSPEKKNKKKCSSLAQKVKCFPPHEEGEGHLRTAQIPECPIQRGGPAATEARLKGDPHMLRGVPLHKGRPSDSEMGPLCVGMGPFGDQGLCMSRSQRMVCELSHRSQFLNYLEKF